MLIFRKSSWHAVQLPFSDPMLTDGHLAAAAAMVVNKQVRGASFETAVAEAEKTMYEMVLRIPREQHNGPQNEEK